MAAKLVRSSVVGRLLAAFLGGAVLVTTMLLLASQDACKSPGGGAPHFQVEALPPLPPLLPGTRRLHRSWPASLGLNQPNIDPCAMQVSSY